MYYYLSIGSNVKPEENAVKIVHALCAEFGAMVFFPFRYTQPEGIETDAVFVNTLAVMVSPLSSRDVKEKLNRLETALGRNRDDPLRGIKNRTADIDIMYVADTFNIDHFAQAKEQYVAQCFHGQGKQPELGVYGLPSFERPATIYLDTIAGDIVVVENEFDRLVNRFKPAFTRQ